MGKWQGNIWGKLIEDQGYFRGFFVQIPFGINSQSPMIKKCYLPGRGSTPSSWEILWPPLGRKRGQSTLPAPTVSQVPSAHNN